MMCDMHTKIEIMLIIIIIILWGINYNNNMGNE